MNRIRTAVLIVLACCMTAATAADSWLDVDTRRVLSVHAEALPTGADPDNLWFIGHHYIASYDTQTKVPTWIAYRVTAADGQTRNSIHRKWIEGLADVTLEADDHVGSDYDIGHMLPLASFKASPHAFESNFLGVTAPQTPALNRGPWLKWESHVRDLAKDGSVQVMAGPLYESDMPPLASADEPHRVPSHYWAVAKPQSKQPQGWIFPQDCDRAAALDTFRADPGEIQHRANLRWPERFWPLE